MMKEEKNVQCPNCGARLKISIKAGSDPMHLGVTCPVCKIKTPLIGYKSLDTPSSVPPVQHGSPIPPVPPAGNCVPKGHGAAFTNATQYMETPGMMGYQGGATVLSPGIGISDTPNPADNTVYDSKPIATLNTPSGESFQLKEGDNIIGRKAASSGASIQIDMGTLKRMGREHLRISVIGSADTSYCFEASLVKEKCNYTAINGFEMKYGNRVFLRHGDRISLPDMELTFIIP